MTFRSLSVCLSVCRSMSSAKRQNQPRCRLERTRVGPVTMRWMGVQIPPRKRALLGFPAHVKTLGLSTAQYTANGCRLCGRLQCCCNLPVSQCHITFYPMKTPPPCKVACFQIPLCSLVTKLISNPFYI